MNNLNLFLLAVVCLLMACSAFAQSAPDYANYKPKFRDDVFILNDYVTQAKPFGIQEKVPVNPSYALDETSALELLVVLAEYKPVLFHSGPFGWTLSGGFRPSKVVPWLAFPDGSVINAGLMAWYWSHGFSQSYLKFCIETEIRHLRDLTEDPAFAPAFANVVRLP